MILTADVSRDTVWEFNVQLPSSWVCITNDSILGEVAVFEGVLAPCAIHCHSCSIAVAHSDIAQANILAEEKVKSSLKL